MSAQSCLNCRSALQKSDNFCPACGQRTDTHRLTISHLAHEFFHAFTHADKSIFSLLWQMITRPGGVARDYIAGRRKRYFNPFTFFLILMGLFVFSNSYFEGPRKQWRPDPQVLSRIPTEAGKANYLIMSSRGAAMSGFIQRNGNLIAMVAIPFIALICWGFYRETAFNYAEFFTASLLFVTVSNLFFTLFIYPLRPLFSGTTFGALLPLLGLVLQGLYFTWCYGRFVDPPPAKARWLKAGAASFTSVFGWMLFSMLLMSLYMYRGWDFYKFFVRMAG